MRNTIMQWTKEIPTEEGWYWIKGSSDVWISEIKDGSIISGVDKLPLDYLKKSKLNWKFCGPLEEPK